MRFYDTNAILRENLDNIEETIYLSSITLLELEHIKVSRNKDEEVKLENGDIVTKMVLAGSCTDYDYLQLW